MSCSSQQHVGLHTPRPKTKDPKVKDHDCFLFSAIRLFDVDKQVVPLVRFHAGGAVLTRKTTVKWRNAYNVALAELLWWSTEVQATSSLPSRCSCQIFTNRASTLIDHDHWPRLNVGEEFVKCGRKSGSGVGQKQSASLMSQIWSWLSLITLALYIHPTRMNSALHKKVQGKKIPVLHYTFSKIYTE